MYNTNKIKKIGIITGISLGTVGIITASTFLIKNYLRKSDCNLPYSHLHVYEYKYGDIETVFHSERINLHGFKWTDRVESYGEDDLDRINYMEDKRLVSVYRNMDYLVDYMENNSDYEEYEYWYEKKEIDYYVDETGKRVMSSSGNVRPVYKYVKKYDYTTDIDHNNLTGDARTVHTKYYLYKIDKNNDGKFTMNKSELVDDITDSELVEYYPYFRIGDFSKKEYYKYKIDTKTKVRK